MLGWRNPARGEQRSSPGVPLLLGSGGLRGEGPGMTVPSARSTRAELGNLEEKVSLRKKVGNRFVFRSLFFSVFQHKPFGFSYSTPEKKNNLYSNILLR